MILKITLLLFSCNPQLVEIKGKDIYEKVKYCETFAECANTDIQAVFDLVFKYGGEKIKHCLKICRQKCI